MIGFLIGCAVLSSVFVVLGLIGDAWERDRRRHMRGRRRQKCNGSVNLSPEREEQP